MTRLPSIVALAFVALLSLRSLPEVQAASAANPLLEPWRGPLGGLPRFDLVKVEDFRPAFDTAMAQQRREVAAIATHPAPPSFTNTIVALERSGQAFNRVIRFYGVWRGSLSTPAVQALEREMQPLLAAYSDELTQNRPLYLRIEAVYTSKARLSAEQRRLVWVYRSSFVKRGAQLDGPAKLRVARINQDLAKLHTQFSQNLLADEDERMLQVSDAGDLVGMTQETIEAARAEAVRRGVAGAWVFPNTRSAIEPLLARASQRSLRERAYTMWTKRGDNGDAHDNNAIVTRILALRDERAKLLGFESHAHWKLSDTMAGTPQRALDLMLQAWRPATAAVARDVALMQKLVDGEHGGFAIQPWDYRYYAEKLRKASYDLDRDELRPYLQLDRVRQAMFWAAGRLYGLRFVPVAGVPVYHRDVSVYAVLDCKGARVGLWYFDPYAREGKHSGAWMSSYRRQARLDGAVTPIVSNNSNFVRAAAGQPVTISWDDAVTMFHEFGHALHGLLSSKG